MSADTRKLKVKDLPPGITKDQLRTLFKNKRGQGGGSVEDVQISEDKKSAVVVFKEAAAVDLIMSKGNSISIHKCVCTVKPFFGETKNKLNDELRTSLDLPNKSKEKKIKQEIPSTQDSVSRGNKVKDEILKNENKPRPDSPDKIRKTSLLSGNTKKIAVQQLSDSADSEIDTKNLKRPNSADQIRNKSLTKKRGEMSSSFKESQNQGLKKSAEKEAKHKQKKTSSFFSESSSNESCE